VKIIEVKETIGLDDDHPDKYCASGHGQFEKCPRFMDRTVKWPFLPDVQQPFCDKFTRDLEADGTYFLRDARCLRDYGSPGSPGMLRHLDLADDEPRPMGLHSVQSCYDLSDARKAEHRAFLEKGRGRI
jgi:hypothetical protein